MAVPPPPLTPPLPPPGGSVADSLLDFARRRGVPVSEESAVADLLAAIDPQPLLPQPLVLVAGAVLAIAFRYDRMMAEPAAAEAPFADRSF